jgi:hypothetical protein
MTLRFLFFVASLFYIVCSIYINCFLTFVNTFYYSNVFILKIISISLMFSCR